MASIDKVQVEIVATAKGTSAVFTQLQSQLTTLKSAMDSIDTSKLQKITKGSNKVSVDTSEMTKAEQAISSEISKIERNFARLKSLKEAALSGDSSSATSFSRRVISLQGDIDALGERLKQLNDNRIGVNIDSDAFQTFRERLAEVQGNLNTAKTAVTDAVSTMNAQKVNPDTKEASSNLSDIAAKAKEAASSLWSMTKSGLKSGFNGLKTTLSSIKNTLTSIGSSASKSVSTGFTKILKYGFGIRSMYVLFRRLKTAIKDSFTELQNSGAQYQTTRANIEALKNSLTTLKYQFGAAFEPIFNTVAPALQTLINYLVTVMNTISAFIAKLTGKSTYSKAVASTAAIAANTGSAAGSAAELNKQLQGFDELNNLDLDSGSGGGSGGGGSSDSGTVQYVEESVDSALTSFWDSLSDAITNGEWYKAGTLISNALTEALNSINWDSIFQSASNFGTGLADFLNGLITDDLFSAVGTTIANALKTALIAAFSFGSEFDWTGLGTAIASGINSFVEANPLDLLVSAFNVWANGILTTLISAIDGISWKGIAQHIADAIAKLDVGGITWKLGKLVTSLANALKDLVSNKETWTNLGNKIAEGINGFFEGFEGSSVAYLLNNLISGLQSMITTALKKIKWSEVAKDIVSFIGNLDLGNIALIISGLYLATEAWIATKTAFSTLLTTNIMSVVGGLGTVNAGTVTVSVLLAASIGWKIGTNIYESASGHEVEQGFIDEITDIWNGFTKDKVEFNLLDFIEFTVEDADGWYGDYRDWVNDLVDCITEDFETLKTSVESAWDSVWYGKGPTAHGYNGATSEAVRYIEGTGQGYDSELNEKGANLWNGIYNGFDKAMKITNPLIVPIEWLKDKFAQWWADTFEEHSPARAVYPLGENLWLGIYNGFKEAMEKFSLSELINDLSIDLLGTGTVKTGSTAQGNFSNSHDTIHKNLKLKTTLSGAAQSKKDVDDLTTSFTNLTTEASKNTEAEYKTSVGGQISDIEELNTWKNTIENLYKKWLGRDAKFTSSEDGFESKISGWLEKLDVLGKDWEKKSKNAKFTTSESGLSSFEGNNGYKAKLANIENQWKNDGKSRTATFTTNLAGNLNTSNALSTAASAMATLNSSFQGDKSASFKVSYDGPSAETLGGYAGGVNSINSSFSSASSKDVSYSISASVDMDSVNSAVSKINNAVKKGLTTKFKISDANTATGGIIAHGVKTHIPQYAGGTLDAGSVFIAGEAGPEVMGHINGRTEILNRSQIASIMSNSFVSAMAQFGNRLLTSPESLATKPSSYTSYSSRNENESYTLIAEQNEILREQNSLLREIASKDTTISSRDVFNAVRSESNSYYNRTGNSPFLI